MKKVLQLPIDFILFITHIEFYDKKFVDFIIEQIHTELLDGKKDIAWQMFTVLFEDVSWINFESRAKLKKLKIELMKSK